MRREEMMAVRTCHNCVYACVDSEQWLRCRAMGQPMLVKCANHPFWPGQLREVPGTACANYTPKIAEPEGEVKHIPLSGGRYALVDAADYEWLSQYKWHLQNGYAARCEKGRRIFMHRQIMQPPQDKFVDHADGKRVNNCRANLRVCTPAENQRNQRKKRDSASIFKGVGYLKNCRRCHAKLVFEGKCVWLGHFDSEVEAARAYDRGAVEYFGEFARLNFPEEWPPERRVQVHAQHAKKRGKPREKAGRDKNKLKAKASCRGK